MEKKKKEAFYKEEIGKPSRVEVKTILHIDGEDEPKVESLEGQGVAGVVITREDDQISLAKTFAIGLNNEGMLASLKALMDLIIKAVAKEQGQESAALFMLMYLGSLMEDIKNRYFAQEDGGDKDVVH